MDALCYEILHIPLGDNFTLILEDDSPLSAAEKPSASDALPNGWLAISSNRVLSAPKPADRPPFYYDASASDRGLSALRLFELRDYSWRIINPTVGLVADIVITSSLQQSKEGSDLWKGKKGFGR